MTPETREQFVQSLRDQWTSTLSRVGDRSARRMFLAAKLSLAGKSSLPVQTRRDQLEAYRQVEEEVFGSIQEVPWERETLGLSNLQSKDISGSETPRVANPPVTEPPSTS